MNLSASALKEVRKMAHQLPRARFYTLCGIVGCPALATLVLAVAKLIEVFR